MNSKLLGILFPGISLSIIVLYGCAHKTPTVPRQPHYNTVERNIKVDGNIKDWQGIEKNLVQGAKHLWIGQGMTLDKWHGNNDHSFSWRAAWFQNKIYFLVEVTDNNFQPCIREYTWLNDCVEIQFDPRNLAGDRIENVTVDTPLQERIGKRLRGYEMHFLPCSPPRVYLDDTKTIYRLENVQNDIFFHQWNGEIETKRTDKGYLLEIGFSVPQLKLAPDMIMGLDVAVGDDDGQERKSLMLWTGRQVPFWITMDQYGSLTLTK